MKKISSVLLSSLFIFYACQQDEVLISGEISGYINLSDENGYSVNAEGVPVKLVNGSQTFQTITESNGWYHFDEVPIGNYLVDLNKDGYITSEPNPIIQHIGGYSATLQSFSMNEVPKIGIQIDSISGEQVYGTDQLMFYGRIQNMTKKPGNGYSVRVFVHNSPDISKTNYTARYYAFIASRNIQDEQFEFRVDISRFYETGERVYFIICPVAASVYNWYSRPEIEGPLSEVFEWEVFYK